MFTKKKWVVFSFVVCAAFALVLMQSCGSGVGAGNGTVSVNLKLNN